MISASEICKFLFQLSHYFRAVEVELAEIIDHNLTKLMNVKHNQPES